jgi:predicted site-specific integrase-resolvase
MSSSGQKPELVNQVAAMSDYCANRGIMPDEIITVLYYLASSRSKNSADRSNPDC